MKGRKARAHVLEHFSTKPVISKVLNRLRAIAQKEHIEILDVPLNLDATLHSSVLTSVTRVNRYLAEGKTELASKIVKKELGSLPESVEILSRIESTQASRISNS